LQLQQRASSEAQLELQLIAEVAAQKTHFVRTIGISASFQQALDAVS
jgi:hypothetical protein